MWCSRGVTRGLRVVTRGLRVATRGLRWGRVVYARFTRGNAGFSKKRRETSGFPWRSAELFFAPVGFFRLRSAWGSRGVSRDLCRICKIAQKQPNLRALGDFLRSEKAPREKKGQGGSNLVSVLRAVGKFAPESTPVPRKKPGARRYYRRRPISDALVLKGRKPFSASR